MYATYVSSSSSSGARSLEEIRRELGEGWQWHRIQAEPCPQCGDYPAALSPSSLGACAVERATAWRDFLRAADEGYLRRSPAFGVFSPIQYGAHVRNILQVYTDRMLLGVERENPVVPIHNPPDEEWESYNRLDREMLAADIEAQARRLANVVEAMDPSAWSRIVTNDRGSYGVYTFTISGLACNAVHEAYHHLLDAKGMLNQGSSS